MKNNNKKMLILVIITFSVTFILTTNINLIENMYYHHKFDKITSNPDDFIEEESGTLILLTPIDTKQNSQLVVVNKNNKPLSSMELDGYYDELDNYRIPDENGVSSNDNSEIVLSNNTTKKSVSIDFYKQKLEPIDYKTSDNFAAYYFEGKYTIFKDIESNLSNNPLFFTETYLMQTGSEENNNLKIISDVTNY